MRGFSLFILLLLSGCAQMQQDWITQHCNTQAAYSQGINDVRHDEDMQSNYAENCPNTQVQINQAYSQGLSFRINSSATKYQHFSHQ